MSRKRKERSSLRNIALYSAAGLMLAASQGCKDTDIAEEMKMYQGSSTTAQDSHGLNREQAIDHYLFESGFHRSGIRNYEHSHTLLSKKLELLEENGKLEDYVDEAVRFPLVISAVGKAYSEGKGYREAKQEIDGFKEKHPDSSLTSKIEEAEQFLDWMAAERNLETPGKRFKEIIRNSDERLSEIEREGKEIDDRVIEETIYKEAGEYINDIVEEADSRWDYERGRSRGWGDEARDVAINEGVKLAQWLSSRGYKSARDMQRNYAVAERIYDTILEDHAESRLAPRVVELKVEHYKRLAKEIYHGAMQDMPEDAKEAAVNHILDKARKDVARLNNLDMRDSKIRDNAPYMIRGIEDTRKKLLRGQY